MRIKLVKSLRGGETLAEAVITEEKEVLISKGTVLKPEYLDLISFLGISTVCIEDPYVSYEIPHRGYTEERKKDYICRVQKILENHIYQGQGELRVLESLAHDIVNDLKDVDENIVIDMEERNGNLYEHTIMVTLLAILIAKKLKLNEEQVNDIALGCLLHDLGLRYITVPYIDYDIEQSAASEIFEYKKHTILAFTALEKEDWLKSNVKKMVLSHHERKDGSGFPLKQKTKEIECSILQVCDAFDCMISGMECKRNSVQETLEYLFEVSDVLFEKRIVKMLMKLVARYPVGTKVKLNTGENGIVISQTEDSAHPIIAILDENENICDIQYNLCKNKKITILQVLI